MKKWLMFLIVASLFSVSCGKGNDITESQALNRAYNFIQQHCDASRAGAWKYIPRSSYSATWDTEYYDNWFVGFPGFPKIVSIYDDDNARDRGIAKLSFFIVDDMGFYNAGGRAGIMNPSEVAYYC